tara:strand:+ start:56 stop:997 length:942 start_codon:yes stop_codon:yes gene_type:complete
LKSVQTEENLISEIKQLCLKANAIILAHYYQAPEIQDIADFIGDSLDLSRKAANNNADIIIFCGVHFMAETAKILSPNKTVLIPDIDAGCSLADDCPADEFQKFRDKNPDHYVVSYINCTAEVKAQSDLICTSSNAVSLVEKIPKDKKIIFAPDQNLGRWVKKNSGRELKLWPGSCIVHETFSEEALLKLQYQNPEGKTIAHPECSQNLLELSDFIGSTSKLLDYISNDPSKTYMVLTEPGIIHQMKKKEPQKIFIEVPDIEGCKCNQCPYMKLNTLEKILDCLKNNSPSIELDPEIIEKAYTPIKRMLDMSS